MRLAGVILRRGMLIDRRTLLRSWQALAAAVAALSAIPAGLFLMLGVAHRHPS